MRTTSPARLAILVAVCGVFLGNVPAIAQTTSSNDTAAKKDDATDSKGSDTFFGSLEAIVVQPFDAAIGKKAPKKVKLKPMPDKASKHVQAFKSQNVAKPDEQTVVFVDPATRQIVGIVTEVTTSSVSSSDSSNMSGTSDASNSSGGSDANATAKSDSSADSASGTDQ